MKDKPDAIDRLLRSAATVPNEPAPELPYGFETRVVAQWLAGTPGDPAISRLLRKVVFTALALIVLASAGAYRELGQGDSPGDSFNNEYAIADTAIGGAFEQ